MKKIFIFTASFLAASIAFCQDTIFSDNFNNNQFAPQWELHPNLTGSEGLIDIADDAGTNVSRGVRMGKWSDAGGFTTNALDLHLDLSGYDRVEMVFCIADINDETQDEDGLFFSANGGPPFKKVLDFKPGEWCDQYGQFPPIDVAQLARDNELSLTSQFVIRFQQHDDGDFGWGNILPDGFYLDDVKVYVPGLAYHRVAQDGPFCDDFEAGRLKDAWAWRFADATSVLADLPTRPSGLAGVAYGAGFYSEYGVMMGKACDDGFATTALDLHLDLSAYDFYELTFMIQDIQDESQFDDAIFFSNDGGEHFKPVFQLNPGSWCDQYGQFPPLQIHKLAAAAELELTDQFVIRFQQHDDGDFGWGNIAPDGFYLDNVCVYVPDLEYYPVRENTPFFDGFSTGSLGSAWAWRFADNTNTLAAVPTRPSNLAGAFTGIGNGDEYAVAIGKACDDGFATNALDLHLNFQGLTEVEMAFQIFDNADETHVDDVILFSNDGGEHFEPVFQLDPGTWCDQYGQFPPLQIHKLAAAAGLDLTDRFVIRFQQHDDGDFGWGSAAPDGFYLDNVHIYVPGLVYDTLPYSEDFETGALSAEWKWRFADSTATLVDQPAKPSNIVGVYNNIGHDSPYAVAMGKACDDNFATNALDLHLNLESQSEVIMAYWLYNNSDETHEDDGIYFSNDGGGQFHKIHDFDFNNISPGQYREETLFVSSAVSGLGLELTSQCIIRFQQHDDGDFGWGNAAPDGIYIDDISISGTRINTTTSEEAIQTRIYPNPATDHLYIRGSGKGKDIHRYRILDLNGRLVKEGAFPGADRAIALSGLPPGLLVLELQGDGALKRFKFLKQ